MIQCDDRFLRIYDTNTTVSVETWLMHSRIGIRKVAPDCGVYVQNICNIIGKYNLEGLPFHVLHTKLMQSPKHHGKSGSDSHMMRIENHTGSELICCDVT